MLILVASGTAALLGVAVHASEAPRDRGDRFEVKRAATSTNKLAAQTVWSTYQASLGASTSSIAGLRAQLTAQGILDQSAAAVPARFELLGRLGLPTNDAGEIVLGDIEIDSVLVHRIDLARETQLVVTTSAMARRGYVDATTNVDDMVTDVFSLEPARWDGLDFALLANNINCIMCHTTVDDARRVYDGAGIADAGEFTRARVGSIESFQFRGDPDSSIAGTLYLGGSAIDEHGDPISDWRALSLMAASLDSEGHIVEDLLGNPILDSLSAADPTSPSPYENLYTDYLGGSGQIDGEMPDTFPLPFRDDGGFDPLTGDLTAAGTGNRLVDDNEFHSTTSHFSGSILGGAIGVLPHGSTISSTSGAERLRDGTETSLAAVTDGNVMLTGTVDNPIRIDGDVAIDGDLIISGPIEGLGSLWVRGNIYVPSDLEYADATSGSSRQFGLNGNGGLNALGLTAGGNIVMGDPYRAQWGEGAPVNGTENGNWNFTLEQTAIFNRGEWVKTQAELPGVLQEVVVGTTIEQHELFRSVTRTVQREIRERRDTGTTREVPVYSDVQIGTREEPVYETVVIPATRPAPYGSPTTERRQTGTRTVPVYERQQTGTRTERVFESVVIGYRDEIVTEPASYSPPRFEDVEVTQTEMQRPLFPNPAFLGVDYVPRYYSFGEGDPVPIQNKKGWFDPALGLWHANERVEGWGEDELTLADPNDPSDPTLYPAGGPVAVIKTLEPTNDWIDADALRGLITDALGSRNADEPFKVDATIYSANSLFGLVPNSPSEGTSGAIRVQGSILSADIGLLGPNGTEVLYDPRSQAVLDIRDETKIDLTLVGTVPTMRL